MISHHRQCHESVSQHTLHNTQTRQSTRCNRSPGRPPQETTARHDPHASTALRAQKSARMDLAENTETALSYYQLNTLTDEQTSGE